MVEIKDKRIYPYVGSGSLSIRNVFVIRASVAIPDTVLDIGNFHIYWEHARELTVNVSTEKTDYRKISISGRGIPEIDVHDDGSGHRSSESRQCVESA